MYLFKLLHTNTWKFYLLTPVITNCWKFYLLAPGSLLTNTWKFPTRTSFTIANCLSLVLKIFKEIHSKGQTIVMVTHEAEYANTADRIIEMKDGIIAAFDEITVEMVMKTLLEYRERLYKITENDGELLLWCTDAFETL